MGKYPVEARIGTFNENNMPVKISGLVSMQVCDRRGNGFICDERGLPTCRVYDVDIIWLRNQIGQPNGAGYLVGLSTGIGKFGELTDIFFVLKNIIYIDM